jgi:hypothetical protein
MDHLCQCGNTHCDLIGEAEGMAFYICRRCDQTWMLVDDHWCPIMKDGCHCPHHQEKKSLIQKIIQGFHRPA